MSVETIDLVRDTTMQEISASLAAIANNTGGLVIKGWRNVQALVRSGLAKRIFKAGDQFIVERETAMNATVGTTEESAGITAASVNEDAFLAAIGTAHNGDYEFIYDGAEWHLGDEPVSLAAYGISVTGTPKHGDVVVVHETAAQMIVTVLGVDQDTPTDSQLEHSLTVGFQDCYAELQFDAPEAFYYAENGLEAGDYYFTIDPAYDATYNTYKDTGYQFTLTQDVPAGGVLMFPWVSNAQAGNIKVSSYASRSATTATESVSVSSGTTGTNLGQLTTAGDPTHNLNSIQRVRYGSNNYAQSAMRQLINSDKAAGSVWTPQSKFDRPPSWANTTAGFLHGMDPDFVAVLGKVNKRTALNTISDGGGYVNTDEKVFLLSQTEVYAGLNNSVNEGGPYRYFSEFSDLSAAGGGADANRIKYRNGAAKYWWLRSPYTGYAGSVRYIYPSGTLSNGYYANIAYGVAPACCIV